MGSSHHNRGHRLSLALGVSLALVGGMPLSALADSPASAARPEKNPASGITASGIMTFEHVRVVNAPIAAAATVPALTQKSAGMRAYVDGAGRLREQSPDEARQVASETRSLKAVKAPLKRGAVAMESNDSLTLYGADGAQGMMLDEESMVFQIARKNADGTVGQQCVTGEASADHALHSHPTYSTKMVKEEVRHDR